MRIIAGRARGFRLSAPPGPVTRPVLDRVKESWFAWLAGRTAGARVLDLYSGVGSLGLEALSRGAASCVFVERDPECVSLLREHLERARLEAGAEVRRADAAVALDDLAVAGARFDMVFLDPPFELARDPGFHSHGGILPRAAGLLVAGGLAMLRRESAGRGSRGPEGGPQAPEGAVLEDRRRWGRSEVLFYRRT